MLTEVIPPSASAGKPLNLPPKGVIAQFRPGDRDNLEKKLLNDKTRCQADDSWHSRRKP